jgi:hypothetical protein
VEPQAEMFLRSRASTRGSTVLARTTEDMGDPLGLRRLWIYRDGPGQCGVAPNGSLPPASDGLFCRTGRCGVSLGHSGRRVLPSTEPRLPLRGWGGDAAGILFTMKSRPAHQRSAGRVGRDLRVQAARWSPGSGVLGWAYTAMRGLGVPSEGTAKWNCGRRSSWWGRRT